MRDGKKKGMIRAYKKTNRSRLFDMTGQWKKKKAEIQERENGNEQVCN